MLAQSIFRPRDASIPLLPGRAPQLLRRAAMPGKLTAQYRAAGTGETLGDKAQLGRRAAEPVNQQYADAPALKQLAAIGKLVSVVVVVHVHQTSCVFFCLCVFLCALPRLPRDLRVGASCRLAVIGSAHKTTHKQKNTQEVWWT